jgi:hypothetical protein
MSKLVQRTALALPLLALVSSAAAASGPAAPPSKEAKEVPFKDGYPVTSRARLYRLSEVKAGDQGVGYTVFYGDKVKPFGFEVLGILPGMLGPHRDVILVKLTGDEIMFTGVISGMSGSPAFIDGRLVGAVSFRFGAFSKEPIAGITPIESMLDIYRGDEIAPLVAEPVSSASPVAPVKVADLRNLRSTPPSLVPPIPHARMTESDQLHAIDTPVMLGGFEPEVADRLRERFQEAGMVAVVGAMAGQGSDAQRSPRLTGKTDPNVGATAGGVPAAPIAPGAPIAAILMRGDLFAAGTGTVTFVEDGLVLGFGHPFFGFGHVVFPMATASILNTLASLSGSFKQAAPAYEVGAITHDRLTAIGGDLGKLATMVPISVLVRRADQGNTARPVETRVEVVDNDVWMPVMLSAAISNASTGRLGNEAGGTVDFVADVHVGDRVLRIEDTYAASAPSMLGGFIAGEMSNVANLLLHNGLEKPSIRKIEVEIRTRNDIEMGWIEAAVPERTWVRAGDEVKVAVRVKPWRGASYTTPMKIKVPADASGDIDLAIGGASEIDRRDSLVNGDRVPSDLDDLLGILQDRRPGRGLFARIYLPRPGLRANAEVLSSLPPSARVALAEPFGFMRRAIAEAFGPEERVAMPRVVFGGVNIPLHVIH